MRLSVSLAAHMLGFGIMAGSIYLAIQCYHTGHYLASAVFLALVVSSRMKEVPPQ